MRILVVALESPGGEQNGLRLPLRQLVDGLRARHDVRLLAYQLDGQPTLPAPDVSVPRSGPSPAVRLGEAVSAVVRRTPTSTSRYAAGLRHELRSLMTTHLPDVVHIVGAPLAALQAEVSEAMPTILTAMDAGSLNVRARADLATGLKRRYLLDEERRMIAFQREHFPRFEEVTMVTAEDAAVIRELVPGVRVEVIGNGVEIPSDDGRRERAVDAPTVLFHGGLSYAPNVLTIRHLVTEVWPHVRHARADARLVLVGRRPAAEVQDLAAANDDVILVGEVPDVWPWLRGADVYACPMTSGTGIKNKLLEAMGAGLACVASPLAVQGLAVTDGQHLVLAGDPASSANSIVELLADGPRRAALGRKAHDYVTRAHSWEAFVSHYEARYDVLAGARR